MSITKGKKLNLGALKLYLTSLNPVPNAQVCVYFTVHITKLQLQITFSKHLCISHSACIHWDPGHWKSCWVCCWYWYQNLGGAPPLGPLGVGHAFQRQRHMRRGGGGHLFLPGFSSLYDAIHGWMTRRMDEWTGHMVKKASLKMTTTFFTICNTSHTIVYWRLFHNIFIILAVIKYFLVSANFSQN